MSMDLLVVDGLTKRFGGLVAVSNLSLALRQGEVHAVIGPNGAGKSSLINLLSGDLHVSAGRVLLEGRDVTAEPPHRRCRAGIGRSYQKTTIFHERTVLDNIRLAAQSARHNALAVTRTTQVENAIETAARAALLEAGLAERAHVIARVMSHGEQRQLEVAMVLATQPKVLLLDEPLAGMGHSEAKRMADVICSLKVGRGVLLVEHDMDIVFAIADRLTVMADGQVIASGLVDDVRRDARVRAAYLGETEEAA